MTILFTVILLVVMGLVLLGYSWRWRQVLICMAAALPWLAIGIGLITDYVPGLPIASPIATVLAFTCLLLIFVALMPSFIKSTEVTRTTKNGETFTSWMQPSKEKEEPPSRRVYRERREHIREIVHRTRR